jgi:hypothetical protein
LRSSNEILQPKSSVFKPITSIIAAYFCYHYSSLYIRMGLNGQEVNLRRGYLSRHADVSRPTLIQTRTDPHRLNLTVCCPDDGHFWRFRMVLEWNILSRVYGSIWCRYLPSYWEREGWRFIPW